MVDIFDSLLVSIFTGDSADGPMEEPVDLHNLLGPGHPDGPGDPPVVLNEFRQLEVKNNLFKHNIYNMFIIPSILDPSKWPPLPELCDYNDRLLHFIHSTCLRMNHMN